MAKATMTTDHRKIQQWVEKRGGKPACVRGTGGRGDTGLLRIDFPGYSGAESLQAIEWDEFFEKFEEQNLALLYQDKTAGGKTSNFNKLVDRNAEGGSIGSAGRRTAKKKAARGGASTQSSRGRAAKKGTKKSKSAAPKKTSGGRAKAATRKSAKKTSGGTKRAAKAGGRKKAGSRR